MIGIIDYGMGNLFSVSKALERLDVPYFISDDADELKKATGFILPGVGAFRDAMKLLNETGLAGFIREETAAGKPLLGICLGMQLLFEESEENGIHTGLGLLEGRVVRFPGLDNGQAYKVPHMGWNKLTFHHASPLLEGLEESHVYFVHSYYVTGETKEELVASADYFETVPAVVEKNRVFGMQFHPEKSGDLGMQLLGNYTRFVKTLEVKA